MAEAQPTTRRGRLTLLARLLMLLAAELRGWRAARRGAADPARRRDRGAAPRHVAAADRGGRAAAGERPDRADPRPARSTPSSPAARSSISIPGCSPSADNANEVQGVIAHELGHITGGHIIRMQRRRPAGDRDHDPVAAARRGGDRGRRRRGRHGARSRPASRRRWAASSPSPASRRTAPTRPAPSYLRQAGISGRGSLAFFQRLQNLEFRLNIPQDDSYARTHPLIGERIARAREPSTEADPAWDRPTDPALEARFQRVRAKLSAMSTIRARC